MYRELGELKYITHIEFINLYEVREFVDIFKYESILYTKLIFLSSSFICSITRELDGVVLITGIVVLTLFMGMYGLCRTAEDYDIFKG